MWKTHWLVSVSSACNRGERIKKHLWFVIYMGFTSFLIHAFNLFWVWSIWCMVFIFQRHKSQIWLNVNTSQHDRSFPVLFKAGKLSEMHKYITLINKYVYFRQIIIYISSETALTFQTKAFHLDILTRNHQKCISRNYVSWELKQFSWHFSKNKWCELRCSHLSTPPSCCSEPIWCWS